MAKALILIAVILFTLAAFGVSSPVALVPAGLAFFASSHLV